MKLSKRKQAIMAKITPGKVYPVQEAVRSSKNSPPPNLLKAWTLPLI